MIRQLDALDLPRLRDIVVAYEIGGVRDPAAATRTELTTRIVDAARGVNARV